MDTKDYYELKNRLIDAIYFYQESKIYETKINLKLSNGDSINIKYKPKNIAHLLGVNTGYLKITGLYTGSSFEILCNMLENYDTLITQIEQGRIDKRKLFSNYIDEKIKNFKRICGINIFDIDFVVEYRQSRNKNQTEPLYDGYYIGYTNDYSLSVIGFSKDENTNIYYPNTSRLMKANTQESDEFLKRLFENQMITIIDIMYKKIMGDNLEADSKAYYYHHQEKLNKLKTCKQYAEMYDGIPSTINSNIYYVDKIININSDNFTSINIFKEIADLISKNESIDILALKEKYEYVDDTILNIVSAYNKSLVSDKNNDSHSYQSTIAELESLKHELIKRESLFKKIEDENNKLKARNKLLEIENKSLNNNQEEVIKILTRDKK